MYFKILPITKDKYTAMGMVNISASFYLEKGDEGWDKYQKEHHVIVPIIPEGGYQGKVDKEGSPVDQKDYDTWLASLPTEERDNPFCNHAIQFEHDVTEEEILYCFEFALAQTHLNYLEDDLHCKNGIAKVVNQDIGYLARRNTYKVLSLMPEETKQTDPDAIKWNSKIANAEAKVSALKEVDFLSISPIYSVRG